MTCSTDVVIVLLTCVAGGLTWVGWGLWALQRQRLNRLRLEMLERRWRQERQS